VFDIAILLIKSAISNQITENESFGIAFLIFFFFLKKNDRQLGDF
jgi:hypothetical protein